MTNKRDIIVDMTSLNDFFDKISINGRNFINQQLLVYVINANW